MAHIGVECLASRHDEDHRTEHERTLAAVRDEEFQRVVGENGPEHLRVGGDPAQPEPGERREPDQGDRAENGSHPPGHVALDREQPDEDRHRRGEHVGIETGVATLSPSTVLRTDIAGVIIPSP